MPDITSRQHSIVQMFKAAARGDGDRALLDGWHLLHDAAAAGLEIMTVVRSGPPPSSGDFALIDQLARRCDVLTVTTAVMAAISPVRTPTGVVALARRRSYVFRDLFVRAPALLVVAADIQDPGNVGAIVRSAEAGGASGVIVTGASAEPWGWKALRASMGSTFRLPTIKRDMSTAVAELRQANVAIVATVPRGGVAMHQIDMRQPIALVVGAEGTGLDRTVRETADEHATIPMESPVESLNVAVAAGILVYEARRQRLIE